MLAPAVGFQPKAAIGSSGSLNLKPGQRLARRPLPIYAERHCLKVRVVGTCEVPRERNLPQADLASGDRAVDDQYCIAADRDLARGTSVLKVVTCLSKLKSEAVLKASKSINV